MEDLRWPGQVSEGVVIAKEGFYFGRDGSVYVKGMDGTRAPTSQRKAPRRSTQNLRFLRI